MKIKNIRAIEILDSRGNPTIRAFVTMEDGGTVSASVPSGASTGSHEAVELRDNEKRYLGKGVLKAINNVNEKIAPILVGHPLDDPESLDNIIIDLDGTDDKSSLGANAILAVSMALNRAAAAAENLPLWQYLNKNYFTFPPSFPKIMFNVVNGGKHANWNFDIQEFIIIPQFQLASESIKAASEIYHTIKKNLKNKGMSVLVGDEGGFSPTLNSNEEVFQLIIESASQAGYENGKNFKLAIDAAASEFFEDGKYTLKKDNKEIDGAELIKYYLHLAEKYQVHSFEDAFAEDDWDNWSLFKKALDPHKLLVGDDLFCTDTKRMKMGKEKGAANALIIKPNQIGSIKETVAAIKLAKEYNWNVVISHRSGETEDSFIADLSYAAAADFLKTGAPTRSDRVAKYNRLLEIENKL